MTEEIKAWMATQTAYMEAHMAIMKDWMHQVAQKGKKQAVEEEAKDLGDDEETNGDKVIFFFL